MDRIAIIVLAAGASKRFGPENKLLMHIEGEAMVAGVVRRMSEVRVAGAAIELLAVTAAGSHDVARVLEALPAACRPRIVVNARADHGLGTSIAAGIAALSADENGAMIVPGDMPRLTPEIVARLILAFQINGCERACHPMLNGGVKVGPVVWPRVRFGELLALDGDRGGRSMLERGATAGVAFTAQEALALADVDTAADLERLAPKQVE